MQDDNNSLGTPQISLQLRHKQEQQQCTTTGFAVSDKAGYATSPAHFRKRLCTALYLKGEHTRDGEAKPVDGIASASPRALLHWLLVLCQLPVQSVQLCFLGLCLRFVICSLLCCLCLYPTPSDGHQQMRQLHMIQLMC